MTHVFLSYSRDDEIFAEYVVDKLAESDIPCWQDRANIAPGYDWRNEIDVGISDAAAVVVILSPSAVISAYVTYEWASAIGKGKTIIPLLLAPCEIHPRLSVLHYLDFAQTRRWPELIDRIKVAIDQDETTDPEPGPPPAEAPAARDALADVVQQTLDYMNARGYQLISLERIHRRIDAAIPEERLNEIPRLFPEVFRSATLKGGKPGLKRV